MNKEFFNEAFKGYEIPEKIKVISTEICNRFAILGICDPMYISNIIATKNNIGDGMGNFTNDAIINVTETAKRIQGCYGCNIIKDEIQEIEFCLINGYMEHEKAIKGLNAFTKRINAELKTCEAWTKKIICNKVLNNNQ